MKYTKNYNFKKPEPYDTRNINDINDSFDLVDAKLKETQDKNTNLDETFKQLIIDKGSNNAEIVAARRDKFNNKTYNSVPDRLDAVSSQLAQIAINVKSRGIDGDTDVTAALQNLIDDLNDGDTLFFPDGQYIISDTIHIDKTINFTGNVKSLNKYYDGGYVHGTTIMCSEDFPDDKYMLEFSENSKMSSISDIVFKCNDGNRLNMLHPSSYPAHSYYVDFDRSVCGVKCSNNSFIIDNCTFYGFGGIALYMDVYTESRNCRFTRCAKPIYALSDCTITNPYIQYGNTGITVNGGMCRILNPRIEQMKEYGIRIYKDMCNIIGGLIDRCEYAGIYAKGSDSGTVVIYGGLMISGTIVNRCGAYYGNTSPVLIPISDYDKASNICIIAFHNVMLKTGTLAGNSYDDGSGITCPAINVYVAQLVKSQISCNSTVTFANCAATTIDHYDSYSVINASGSEILKFDKINNNITSAIIGKTYKTLASIGATSTSTISEILSLLPTNSELKCQGWNESWRPVTQTGYWTLKVFKGSDVNYCDIIAINNSTNKHYRYNPVNATWYVITETAV